MKKSLLSTAVITLSLAASCTTKTEIDPLAESGRTQRTEDLLITLRDKLPSKGYLIGHQDSPIYGHSWFGDTDRTDVKDVCGAHPALMGFDLGHLELGDEKNLDGVPFDLMREAIIAQYNRGGVVTLSWHLDNPYTGESSWVESETPNPEEDSKSVASILEGGEQHDKFNGWLDKVADFLGSLKTEEGVKVPVIFRPWHENDGSWFWWGKNLCSIEEYKALWKMTYNKLKKAGVTNVLYAYSPGNSIPYEERYPGDDIIDVVGFDCYCFSSPDLEIEKALEYYTNNMEKNLTDICAFAKAHNKAAVVSETGFEGIPVDDWWTNTLMPVLNRHEIAYVLFWRNAYDKPTHFYMSYPGHSSTEDFVKFYNDPKTLFIGDF